MKRIAIALIVILVAAGGYYFIFKGRQVEAPGGKLSDFENETTFETVAENVNYWNGVTGYFVRPRGPGNYPGVVMIHEWWGLNGNIKSAAESLAASGYSVLAVDLYGGEVSETSDRARELVGLVDRNAALENMRAAVRYLRDRGAGKVASLGWCFGGGKSLELSLSGDPLDATVIYYGSLTGDRGELGKIKWPVLGIFGEEDSSIPVESVRSFEAALSDLGVNKEIYVYPGVGHAFANPSNPDYAPKETADAWQKTLTFLAASLR